MKTKRIATIGLLIALAMILSYVESLFPVFFAVPGMKLGLTNLVVIVALYLLKPSDAFLINIIRILLVAFTFGNMFAMLYSLAGGMLSFLVMYLLKKSDRFGSVGISAAGGVAHNLGQIIVAIFVLETKELIYYFPVLCITGVAAGLVIGLIGGEVVKRLPKNTI